MRCEKKWKQNKYICQAVLIGCLSFVMGCGGKEMPEQESAGAEIDGSENIMISYDISQIEDLEAAYIYKADYYKPDEELLKAQLLHGEVTKEEPNAVGKTFQTDDTGSGKEGLTIYSIGQSEEGMFGGFLYSCHKNGKEYQDIISIGADHPDRVEQIQQYNARKDYSCDSDLDFMSREEVQAYAADMIEKCQLPEMEIRMIYALDQDTMQKHREMAAETNTDIDTSVRWEKDDEAYLLQLNEVIDGIPVMDHYWEFSETARSYEPTEVPVEMIVSKDGIVNLNIVDAVEVQGQGEKCTLIGAEEAEELFLSVVKEIAQTTKLTAEESELKYLVLHEGDELVLRPAWVFCVFRDTVDEDEMVPVKEYEHYVFDAVTGERLRSAKISG